MSRLTIGKSGVIGPCNVWTARGWRATCRTQNILQETKYGLQGAAPDYLLLTSKPVALQKMPTTTKINDLKTVQPGSFVACGTSIFRIETPSAEERIEIPASHVFQIDGNYVTKAQPGKPRVDYVWELEMNYPPRLHSDSPYHFRFLNDSEYAMMSTRYRSTRPRDIRSVADQGYTRKEPPSVQYPAEWQKHPWYSVRLTTDLTGEKTDGSFFVMEVSGAARKADVLDYKPNVRQAQTVMSGTGLIFLLSPHGPNLIGIFDSERVHLQEIKASPYVWTLKFNKPPFLTQCTRTEGLTWKEFEWLNEFVAISPTAEKPQVFASGPSCPIRADQVEDTPASGIFGPSREWSGIFLRNGKEYLQLGEKGDSHAKRLELRGGEKGHHGWHVATFRAEFWIQGDIVPLCTWKKVRKGYVVTEIGQRDGNRAVRRRCSETGELGDPVGIDYFGRDTDFANDIFTSDDETADAVELEETEDSAEPGSTHEVFTPLPLTGTPFIPPHQRATVNRVLGQPGTSQPGTSQSAVITQVTPVKRNTPSVGSYTPESANRNMKKRPTHIPSS